MLKAIGRWLVPGVVVVIGGTALTVFATEADIASDLSLRSISALAEQGDDWPEIQFTGRDAQLHGTAPSQADVDLVRTTLLNVHGVRSVEAAVVVAPLARPYEFSASIADGKITLHGGVPDTETRNILVASIGASDVDLQLNSGFPPRSAWLAAANFALQQLRTMDQGSVSLSDLNLTISGRASTERSYGDALLALEHPPEGTLLASTHIEPPLAQPYEWAAQSDGSRIFITGFVPDDVLVDRYHTADVGNLVVATGLSLASGAPEGFADDSQLLLSNLARLDYGAITIIDGHKVLTGAASSAEIAQAVTDQVKPSGTIVVLEPPKVADFHLSGVLAKDGTVKLDGDVPDEVTRQYLTALAKSDVAGLTLARGGPDRFQSALEFAVAALKQMTEGRFEIRLNAITLQGIANTTASYKSLLDLRQTGAPQGFELAAVEVSAPPANPFVWKATKGTDGKTNFSGYFPDAKARSNIAGLLKTPGDDATTFASGEPDHFVSLATVGISLLNSLKSGSVDYDGTGWTLSGQAQSDAAIGTVKAAFVAQNLAASGWTLAVSGDTPAPVSPYVWSATMDEQGALAFAGNVPNAGLQKYLTIHAGGKVTDTSVVSSGAPTNFAGSVRAGLDALLGLQSGSLKYDGSRWALSGSAAAGTAASLKSALTPQIDPASWTVDIAEAKPVAPPAPYVWSATRDADGKIKFAGALPTDTLQRFIAARAGTVDTDTTKIDANAPEGFISDVLAAVDALGKLNSGIVAYDGKQWSISGELTATTTEADVTAALASAATPADKWSKELTVKLPGPVAETPTKPEPAKADPNYAFGAIRAGEGVVTLSGQVPADPARSYFAAITGAPGDGLTIAPNPPENFLTAAEGGLRTLLTLEDGKLALTNGVWSLSGKVPDQAAKDVATKSIAALPGGADWKLDISAPPMIDACRAALVTFAQNDTILFQSGAAVIKQESLKALDDLAADLALCPDNAIEVEGHTDADGDENANLALSVARSEAVIDALISRNVLAARLYAVGYGESKPIASNDTDAGKKQNRRIVINVLDQHY